MGNKADSGMPSQMVINIKTLRYESTDLIIAVSDDMKGFYVHGRTDEELQQRVPVAIRALLEAQGHQVVDVSELEPSVGGFSPTEKTFGATIGHGPQRVLA